LAGDQAPGLGCPCRVNRQNSIGNLPAGDLLALNLHPQGHQAVQDHCGKRQKQRIDES
jgi:hypothetical protein